MKTKKVLIAEHNPGHTELLIEELNVIDTKMEILSKKDGRELMAYFQQSGIDNKIGIELQIDLIIVGLSLPKIHCMEVLRYLKNDTRYRSIPVIIFLKTFDTETISKVYKNGANDFIRIPASFKEFKENIEMLKKYLLNQTSISTFENGK